MSSDAKTLIAILAYVAMAAFTIGFSYRTSCAPTSTGHGEPSVMAVLCATPAGIIWPIYWSAYAGATAAPTVENQRDAD